MKKTLRFTFKYFWDFLFFSEKWASYSPWGSSKKSFSSKTLFVLCNEVFEARKYLHEQNDSRENNKITILRKMIFLSTLRGSTRPIFHWKTKSLKNISKIYESTQFSTLIPNTILVLLQTDVFSPKSSSKLVKIVRNHTPTVLNRGMFAMISGFWLWKVGSFVALENGYRVEKTRTR